MNRKPVLILLLFAVIGEGVWLFWRGRQLDELRLAHTALRQPSEAATSGLSAALKAEAISSLTPAQHAELLSLRGQVSQLRRDIQAAGSQVEVGKLATGNEEFFLEAVRRQKTLYHSAYGPGFTLAISRLSTLLADTGIIHGKVPEAFTPEMLSELGQEAAALALQLELFPDEEITAKNNCCIVIAREREARPSPDGGWLRLYLMANGSWTVAQQTGTPDWDQWERLHRGELRETLRVRWEPSSQ